MYTYYLSMIEGRPDRIFTDELLKQLGKTVIDLLDNYAVAYPTYVISLDIVNSPEYVHYEDGPKLRRLFKKQLLDALNAPLANFPPTLYKM